MLSLAQEEAQRFQHNYIGTEHLLLGLIREGEGVAAYVLMSLGTDLKKLRSSVEYIIGRGDRIVLGEIGLTPRAKKVIELAVDEARVMGHHYIGTEHLLLGLVREGEGIAAGALESQGIRMEQVRKTTLAFLELANKRRAQAAEAIPEVPQETEGADQTDTNSDELVFVEDREEVIPTSVFYQAVLDEDDLTPAPVQEGSNLPQSFSMRANRALDATQEEARRLGHDYVGTEHLLLVLMREENGPAALILQNLGVERAMIHRAIEYIINRRPTHTALGKIGWTPRTQKAVQLAIEEANTLNDALIGTQHLLFGLLREGEGIAAGVLQSLGVTVEKARKEWEAIRES